jgi:hypothetical protein
MVTMRWGGDRPPAITSPMWQRYLDPKAQGGCYVCRVQFEGTPDEVSLAVVEHTHSLHAVALCYAQTGFLVDSYTPRTLVATMMEYILDVTSPYTFIEG